MGVALLAVVAITSPAFAHVAVGVKSGGGVGRVGMEAEVGLVPPLAAVVGATLDPMLFGEGEAFGGDAVMGAGSGYVGGLRWSMLGLGPLRVFLSGYAGLVTGTRTTDPRPTPIPEGMPWAGATVGLELRLSALRGYVELGRGVGFAAPSYGNFPVTVVAGSLGVRF